MGTGGGGSADRGKVFLKDALEDGLSIEWVDANTIPDDAWTVSPYLMGYLMGSIAPPSPEKAAALAELDEIGVSGLHAMERSVRELEEYIGEKIGAIVPVELGASNTPAPIVVAARLGIPAVDGDYVGRAIPEEMQQTTYVYDKKGWPFTSVDRWGNVCIVKEAYSLEMMERIGKALSMAAYDHCSMAAYLLNGSEMRECLVPGTLTMSLELGRTIRMAREEGNDPVEASVECTGGWLLFEGEVSKKEWEDREGYMVGTSHIVGKGDYEGQTLKVWFKNENLVSWLDDQPFVTSPDPIVIADRETGEGITNTLLDEGQEVAVIGIKGQEVFRSQEGLSGTGPRHFGFDIDYLPIEERIKK
jgi:DUF917 family protein